MRPARFLAALAGLACSAALPHLPRQDSGTTIVVQNTYQTPNGPMTETCTITMTPTAQDPNGQAGVQEVKSCTTAPASVSGATGMSATIAPTVSLATPSPASPTAAPASAPAASSAPAAISVDGLSSVVLSSATPAASSPLGGIASASATAPSASALADNAPSASPSVSITPQAAAAVTPFALPGQHLMILPVGLVLFCVVTGVGIAVWTVVTVERVLYRRDFRAKRRAEMAVPVGLGGYKA